MAESNESKNAAYNMYGWRAHLRFDPVLLNAELERRYSSQPDQGTEKLDFFLAGRRVLCRILNVSWASRC